MKKVAFLIQSLSNGGAERALSNLTVNITDKNIEKYIITYRDIVDYEYDGHYISMNFKEPNNLLSKFYIEFKAKKKLKKIKEQYKFDIVVSFLTNPNLINIKTKGKEKVILSVRNHRSTSNSGLVKLFLDFQTKKYYDKSDKIIGCSKVVAQDLVDNFGQNKNKVTSIYNSFDFDKMKKTEKKDGFFDDNYFNIVNVGRLVTQKGQWHLINIMKEVIKENSKVRLYIFGDGPLKKEFEKKIEKNNLKENVFLMGFKKNIYEYIKSSNLMIVTSLYEGIVNVITESLILNTPVFSVDCLSGPRELLCPKLNLDIEINSVYKGEYGYLFPHFKNVSDIKKTISGNFIIEKMIANKVLEVSLEQKELEEYKNKIINRGRQFDKLIIAKQWLEEIKK